MAEVPANLEDARKRSAELVREIRRHARLYYVFDSPEISDAAYDSLMRELEAIEAAYPELVDAAVTHPDRRLRAASALRARSPTAASAP